MPRPDLWRGTERLTLAVALITAMCVGCAQAPGGPVGELVTSTESARSGVLTARRALVLWDQGRLPRTVTTVTVDDALSTAYDAVGVVIALDVDSPSDDRRRSQVQHRLSDAVDAMVRARGVLIGDPAGSAVSDAVGDLDRFAAELDELSRALTG